MRNRAERRRNAIAKDLRTPKYRKRVIQTDREGYFDKRARKFKQQREEYLEEDDDLGLPRLPSSDGIPTGYEPD